jgi:hypothetical protein
VIMEQEEILPTPLSKALGRLCPDCGIRHHGTRLSQRCGECERVHDKQRAVAKEARRRTKPQMFLDALKATGRDYAGRRLQKMR